VQFDPNRLIDLGGLIGYSIRTWGPVELALVAPQGAFRESLEPAFIFHPADLWSAAAIQKNWIHRMNERYYRARDAKSATLAHTEKVADWVNNTRAVAADVRVVYGDRLADLLQSTADEMHQANAWLAARIEDSPTRPEAIADVFLTIDLWAWDQYRTALEANSRANGLPGLEAGRTKLLSPAIEARAALGLPTMDDKAWTMRIRRLRIRPGEEDNLMADVLSASRSGPYDSNGEEIPPR
jgi:hypothetical protein